MCGCKLWFAAPSRTQITSTDKGGHLLLVRDYKNRIQVTAWMAKEVLIQGCQENYGVCLYAPNMCCFIKPLCLKSFGYWSGSAFAVQLDKWKHRMEHFSCHILPIFLSLSISLSVDIINQIPINCACQKLMLTCLPFNCVLHVKCTMTLHLINSFQHFGWSPIL